MEESHDLALVIAWPDVTARGDEKWMKVLKTLGVVKNLNFKVGHAAIILVRRATGGMVYYDFGRYITPRGYGRARSASFDPRLSLHTRAVFTKNGNINNISAIVKELHQMENATHGGGRMFFSVAKGISYNDAVAFANQLVDRGPVKYGAIAKGNNSCSRFVAQTLLAGIPPGHPGRKQLLFPESGKPSPMSNVVNAVTDRTVYCHYDGSIITKTINRWQSFQFQINLLQHNFSASKARSLPCDQTPGSIDEPVRPFHLPQSAQWLGGIGEGAWFALEKNPETDTYYVTKYASQGDKEYRVSCAAVTAVDLNTPYRFTYDLHHQRHTLLQGGLKIVLEALHIPVETAVSKKTNSIV